MKLDIRVDSRRLEVNLRDLAKNAIPAATARALNRAATSARAEAVRAVRAEVPLSARALRPKLRLFRASKADLRATIAARGDYDPPLTLYGPRWRQRQPGGATVRAGGRGSGRLTVLGSFVATTTRGRQAVFRRVGATRKPIRFLRATDAGLPTLAEAFLQAAADGAVRDKARRRFVVELERELRFRGTR